MAWCDKRPYADSSSFMRLVANDAAEFNYVHGSTRHPSTGETFGRFRSFSRKQIKTHLLVSFIGRINMLMYMKTIGQF